MVNSRGFVSSVGATMAIEKSSESLLLSWGMNWLVFLCFCYCPVSPSIFVLLHMLSDSIIVLLNTLSDWILCRWLTIVLCLFKYEFANWCSRGCDFPVQNVTYWWWDCWFFFLLVSKCGVVKRVCCIELVSWDWQWQLLLFYPCLVSEHEDTRILWFGWLIFCAGLLPSVNETIFSPMLDSWFLLF